MEHKSTKRRSSATRGKRRPGKNAGIISEMELARLGGGEIAYIRSMTTDEAMKLYAVKGLPSGIDVYALTAADGTPIALTDSRQAALGHARGDKLQVASIH
jgi:hypothetical protein